MDDFIYPYVYVKLISCVSFLVLGQPKLHFKCCPGLKINPEFSTLQGDPIYFKNHEAMKQRQMLTEAASSVHPNLKISLRSWVIERPKEI